MEIVNNESIKGPLFGMRHLQALLLFLDVAILYINRLHIAVTVVAMTNAEQSNAKFTVYNWNEKQKSYILSSFYWGYVLTQFASGYSVRFFGAKINLLIYTLATGLLSLLVPFCVPSGGWKIFCLLRFLMGIFQGGMYPAMQQHLSKWSPPCDRALLCGFTHMGFDLGIVLAMAFSGVLAAGTLGWPGIFYISAALCFLWCILWSVFGANNVQQTKLISSMERTYIEDSLKSSVEFENTNIPVPWRAIFTSKGFYALLVVRSAGETGFFTIQTEWPSYLNAVLKFNITDNAIFSALPPLVSMLFVFLFLFIEDVIAKRNLLSLTASRKFFNSLAMWIPAIGVIIIGFLDQTQKWFAIVLMTLLVAIHSCIFLGSILNPLDIAPNHTSTITAIVNTVANLTVLLGPLYVGIILNDEGNPAQWRIVFFTAAIVFIVGDATFLIWGTAKEQPWNAADFLDTKNVIGSTEIIANTQNESLQTQCNEANAHTNLCFEKEY